MNAFSLPPRARSNRYRRGGFETRPYFGPFVVIFSLPLTFQRFENRPTVAILVNSKRRRATMSSVDMRAEILTTVNHLTILKRRQLPPARVMAGDERRLMNPNRGPIKLCERYLDILFSRFIYPPFGHIRSPYCWVLERRFGLAETKLAPAGWPRGLAPLRVLYISDIHGGIFLKAETLRQIVLALMREKPDLVVVAGDIVTGHTSEATRYLDGLA